MSFYSLIKGLSEKNAQVTVEMKNDLEITGYLKSVDHNLNVALDNISVTDSDKYPYLLSSKSCFIRGNVVRYIHFNKKDIDVELVEEACRKEAASKKESNK